jgi:autotransporter-associated beta strand protein
MQAVNSRRAVSSSIKKSSRTRAKRSLAVAAAAGLSSLMAPGVQQRVSASPFYWSGAHDTNWNTTGGIAGSNWSSQAGFNQPTGLPGSSDDVFFSIPTATNFSSTALGQNFTINSLTFSAAETGNVSIGGNNTLTIGAGGLINNSFFTNTLSTAVTISGNQAWMDNTSSPVLVTGAIGGNATSGLTYSGGGTFNLSGANSYSGSTSLLNNGTILMLSGANGAIASSASVTLDGGTELIMDNTAASNTGRLGSTAPITSRGGTIYLKGSNATSQSVGNLSTTTGLTTIEVDTGNTLTFGNWTHTAGSAINFDNTITGANGTVTVSNGAANSANGTIGGWATIGNISAGSFNAGNGSFVDANAATNVLNFAKNDGSNHIVAFTAYNNNSFAAGANTKVTSTTTQSASVTINSLYITGAANLVLGTGTLTIASGGIIANGGNETFGGAGPQINFGFMNDIGSGTVTTLNAGGGGITGSITSGTSDLVITTATNLRIDANIIGATVNLVKDGSGLLDFSDGNNNNATNSYGGTTTINGGIIVVHNDSNLGAVPGSNLASEITLNGGELRMTATITLNTRRGITVGPQGGTLSYNGGNTTVLTGFLVTGSGGITYEDIPSFGISTGTNQCAMEIGFVSTNYAGSTTFLTQGNANTNATNATIYFLSSNEVPSASATTVLGLNQAGSGNATKGLLNLAGTTQQFGSLAGNGSIITTTAFGTANLIIGANNLSTTYLGNLGTAGLAFNNGAGNHTGQDNGTSAATITLTKVGTGTQTLGGTNGYTGATNINGGKLSITGSLANTAVTVGNGTGVGSLGGNGTIAGAVSVSATGHLAPAVSTSTTSTLTLSNNLSLTTGGNATTGATFDYNFGAPGNTTVGFGTVGTGDMVIAGNGSLGNFNIGAGNVTLNVTPLTGFGVGTYDIINWSASSGTFTNSATFNVNGSSNFNYQVVNAGGALSASVGGGNVPAKEIYLEVLPGNPNFFWTQATNGNWNLATPNWTSAGSGSIYSDGSNVTFNDANIVPDSGTSNVTVVAGGVNPNTVTFSDALFNLSISGGNISVANAQGIIKNLAGTVTLNNNVTTPATTINGGTLAVGAGGMLNSTTLTVNSGATLSVASLGNLSTTTALVVNNGNAAFSNAAQNIASLSDLSGNTSGVVTLNGTALGITGNSTYDGTITGNGSLAISNGATVTLTNANSHTGGTTLSGANTTLVVSGNGSTGSGPVTVNANTTLSGNGSALGAVGLSGTLSPAGPGVIGNISLGALTAGTGATLQYDFTTPGNNDVANVTGNASFSGNETLTLNENAGFRAGNYTLVNATGNVSDSGNFTFVGSGVGNSTAFTYSVSQIGSQLVLTVGANTLTWTGLNGSGGNGNWANADVAGNWTPVNYVDGYNVLFDDTGINGNITITGTVNPSAVTFNNSAVPYTIGGGTIGGFGNVTLNNNGNVTFTGTNTYSGGTFINSGGTLNISADGALGATTGNVTLNTGGTLGVIQGSQIALAHDIIIATNGTLQIGTVGGGNNSAASKITINNAGSLLDGAGNLTETGNGTLLIQTANGFSGNAIVNGGVLELQVANALAAAATITVNNGGELALSQAVPNAVSLANGSIVSGEGTNLGALSGNISVSGNVTMAPRFFNNNTSVGNTLTMSGNISGGGNITVDSTGATSAGTVVFTGTNNTYTGTTTVNVGKLYVNSSTPAASAAFVNNGATLGGLGTVNGNVTLNAGGNLEGGQNLAGTLTIGSLTAVGNSTIGVGNLPNYPINTNTPVINDLGTVTLGGNTVTFSLNGGLFGNGTAALLDYTGAASTAGFAVSNPHDVLNAVSIGGGRSEIQLASGGNVTWTNSTTNSLWDINSSSNWIFNGNATNFFQGDKVVFDDTPGANQTINIGGLTVVPASTTFNNNNFTYSVGGGTIGGGTSLVMNGNSTTTLTGNNTYTGGTFINAGTLSIAADTALGTVPSAPTTNITLNGGTLQVTAGTQANSGNLSIATNRTITLGANGGTINIGFVNPGTGFQSESALNFSGLITGNGSLTITGQAGFVAPGNVAGNASYMELLTPATYTGNTTINDAIVMNRSNNPVGIQNILPTTTVLNLINGGAFDMDANNSSISIAGLNGDTTAGIGSTNGTATNLTTITINGSGNYLYQGSIGPISLPGKIGAGASTGLAITGTGTETITNGTNAINGTQGTSVTHGRLFVDNSSGTSGLGTGPVAVSGTGTIGGNSTGTGTGNVAINSGGTITAGFDGLHAGTFTIGSGAVGNLTMGNGSTYLAKFNDFNGNGTGVAGTNWDVVNVGNSLNFPNNGNQTVTVAMASYGDPAPGLAVNNFTGNQTFEIAAFAATNLTGVTAGGNQTIQLTDQTTGLGLAPYTGQFALNTAGFTNDTTASSDGSAFLEFIGSGAGTGGTLDIVYGNYTATPEPGTMLLVLAGGLPMLAARRRRRQKPTTEQA